MFMNQQQLELGNDATPASRTKRLGVYRVELVRDRSIAYGAGPAITTLDGVAGIIGEELAGADRERLICLWLNARHGLIGMEVASVGTRLESLVNSPHSTPLKPPR